MYILVGFVFFSCSLSCGIIFLFLAQKWKDLAMMWYRCEKVFLNLPYKECGWRLSTKIRVTAVAILLLAIGEMSISDWWLHYVRLYLKFFIFHIAEHSMYLSSTLYNFCMKVSICKPKMDDPWKYFFVHEHPHIFSVLPYHFLFTILIEVTR